MVCVLTLLEKGFGGGMDVAVGHWENSGDSLWLIAGMCGKGVLACGGLIGPFMECM